MEFNYDYFVKYMPFCRFTKTSDGKVIYGIAVETELLKFTEKRLNFRSNIRDANYTFGRVVNGTWTGLIGDVYYRVKY